MRDKDSFCLFVLIVECCTEVVSPITAFLNIPGSRYGAWKFEFKFFILMLCIVFLSNHFVAMLRYNLLTYYSLSIGFL